MEPIRLRCPGCDKSLQVPADKAGQRIRCGGCKTIVAVPANPEPEPPLDDLEVVAGPPPRRAADEDDEPAGAARRPRRPTRDRTDRRELRKEDRPPGRSPWLWVRIGLILLLVAVGVEVLSWLGAGIPQVAAPRFRGGSGVGALVVALYASFAVRLLTALIRLAGYCLCLPVPDRHRARTWAVITLIAGIFSELAQVSLLGMQVWTMVAASRGMPAGAGRVVAEFHASAAALTTFLALLGSTQLIAVPLFLKALGRTLDAPDAEHYCEKLLYINIAKVVLSLTMSFVFSALGGSAIWGDEGARFLLRALIFGIGLTNFILTLVYYGWYVLVLWRLLEETANARD
jgi:hypothetical protein